MRELRLVWKSVINALFFKKLLNNKLRGLIIGKSLTSMDFSFYEKLMK